MGLIDWTSFSVLRKGSPAEVFRAVLNRAPSGSEYAEIKQARNANPDKYLRLGDVSSDGRIFLRINPTGLDGEQWTNAAGREHIQSSGKIYRIQNKAKVANRHKEYYQRNRMQLLARMKHWQQQKHEHFR